MIWKDGKKIKSLFFNGNEIKKMWYNGKLIFQKDTIDKTKFFMRIWWKDDGGVVTEEIIDNLTDFNNFRRDPVLNSTITLSNGHSFKRVDVIDIDMGNSTEFPNNLGDNFLNRFSGLDPTYPFKFPDNVTSIGNRCLYNCYKFNVPIDFNNVTDIGDQCLYMSSSAAFNSEIKMEKIKNIGSSFMHSYGSSAIPFNNNISFGNSLLSIGNDFLLNCKFFNKPIILSDTITSIGSGFLNGCSSFSNIVELGNSLTTIGSSFLRSTKFNSDLTFPASLTSIGSAFLRSTPYNKIIDLSMCTELSSIGSSFLKSCETFNKQIIFPTENPFSIGEAFCSETKSLVQTITLPPNITSVGGDMFYRGLNATSGLTIICNMDPEDISTAGYYSNAFGSYASNVVVYIGGVYKNELVARFPNKDTDSYRRNLVLI